MRNSIRAALEQSAELTSQGRLVDGFKVGEAAISQATDAEHPEIQQWLADHVDDYTRRNED